MDYPITNKNKSRLQLWKEFEYLDIIPYSLAVLLILASIFIVTMTIELTNCPHYISRY